jgi:uncharacterized YigZ family protein
MAEEMKRVTLLKSGSATLVEKKSEFIGYACPVTTEDEAIEFVKSIKKKHADARHNVYAYMIGQNIARYSDDGEPQGTGGIPVLDVIRKSGFTDAVIVVTRYFGGILLGAGGLVRAYSAAAKMAVDDSGIVTYDLYKVFDLKVNYTDYGKLTVCLSGADPINDGIDFAENVTLSLALPSDKFESFKSEVIEITAGRAEFNDKGTRFDKQ